MSFQNGLSGLNAAAKDLDVIGNNVANVNTVGAKAGRAQFADVYANSLYGRGTGSNGIGVTVAAVDQQFKQGDITTTNNPLDMAVNGSGFFRLSTNGSISYSRNGEFQLDKDNYIVSTSGARLTGYSATPSGQIQVGSTTELKVNMADVAPQATVTSSMQLNLDARNTVSAAAFTTADPTTYTGATSINVYDQQGNAHVLTTYYKKTADNSWDVYGTTDGATMNGGAPVGQLTFNADGSVASPTTPLALAIPVAAGVGGTQNITLDLTKLTQYGSTFAVNAQKQDGFAAGQVSGFSVNDDGTIMATYTNGQSKAQGQVVLANFSNPQGLAPEGGNAWTETAASGQELIGAPGSGALGGLKAGAVESSNIDLTNELVNMITAQRSYQANAQTIKTQDEVLQTVVNLRN